MYFIVLHNNEQIYHGPTIHNCLPESATRYYDTFVQVFDAWFERAEPEDSGLVVTFAFGDGEGMYTFTAYQPKEQNESWLD